MNENKITTGMTAEAMKHAIEVIKLAHADYYRGLKGTRHGNEVMKLCKIPHRRTGEVLHFARLYGSARRLYNLHGAD